MTARPAPYPRTAGIVRTIVQFLVCHVSEVVSGDDIVQLRPSIEPATKPPMAGFQLSSLRLRFAEAHFVNSYAPPIAPVMKLCVSTVG